METKIASRAELVVCGMAVIPEAVKVFAPNVTVEIMTPDGTLVPKGTALAVLKGPSNEMLQLERPVLNIVGRLSGIATGTRKYHQAILDAAGQDCKTKLLDTRKVSVVPAPSSSSQSVCFIYRTVL